MGGSKGFQHQVQRFVVVADIREHQSVERLTMSDLSGVGLALCADVSRVPYIVFSKTVANLSAAISVSVGLAVAALVVLPFGMGGALLAPHAFGFGLFVAVFSGAMLNFLEMIALGDFLDASSACSCAAI